VDIVKAAAVNSMNMNRSYRIGYRFERRVIADLKEQGWTVFRQSKSSFPDLICFKYLKEYGTMVMFVECKVNGYLSKEEKLKAEKIARKLNVKFYVALRKNRNIEYKEVKWWLKSNKESS
jgi:Holliday junction resolvase